MLGTLGLYAGASVGLSAVSTVVPSGWAVTATYLEESGEALAAVAFLMGVLVGVAPRLVLPPPGRCAGLPTSSPRPFAMCCRAAPPPTDPPAQKPGGTCPQRQRYSVALLNGSVPAPRNQCTCKEPGGPACPQRG